MMPKREVARGLVIITALMLILGYSSNAGAQKTKPEIISFPDLLRMFADQPDHMADRTIVINDSVIKIRFAKKQTRVLPIGRSRLAEKRLIPILQDHYD